MKETKISASMRSLIPVVVVAILGFSAAAFLSSPTHNSAGSLTASQSAASPAQSVPPEVWSQAPYPGWQYYVSYSSPTGNILAIVAMQNEQVVQDLANCAGSSVIENCLFPQPAGQQVINVTMYTNISTVASHMNAYFVNPQTQEIELKSEWTNCTDPNYGNGTMPCS